MPPNTQELSYEDQMLARFAPKPKPLPAPEPEPELEPSAPPEQEEIDHPEPRPAYRKYHAPIHPPAPEQVRKRLRLVTPERFFVVLTLVVLAVLMVNSQMQLTSLTADIATRQASIKTLESEYTALEKRRMDLFSAENIEYYATEVLGMVKMDFANVEYVEITNPDSIEVTEKGLFQTKK